MADHEIGKPLTREEDLPHHNDKPGIQVPLPASDATSPPDKESTVRFASTLQEIAPAHSLETKDSSTADNPRQPLSPEAEAELKQLTMSMSRPEMLSRRMTNFAFEPVSLPVSRVPSSESPRTETGPRIGFPTGSAAHTPPLTPATSSRDIHQSEEGPRPPSSHITPQASEPEGAVDEKRPSSASVGNNKNFTLEPSASDSQDGSPATTPGPGSGTVTPPTQYSRPSMPAGDKDDPYARSRRLPQSRNLDSIDANFIFGSNRPGNRNSIFGGGSSQPSSRNNSTVEIAGHDRKPSTSAVKNIKEEHKGHNSMSDLKRFFRFGGHKRSKSPAPANAGKSSRSSTMIAEKPAAKAKPSPTPSQVQLPFADDHGLESKYGKFGKVLGSGAGGSVRLMKRSSDGTTFAVKQFRDRHPHESERDYNKKVTAEFCVGSTLHHGNIIETLDIIHENHHWFEVMEYAPYDLFAIVMTGRMSREEVTCCFLQIFAGVTYLHGMGLAHRDLKLDNVVVNEHGIMKIIDFGSAIVYRYPFETDIVLATGIVGSDPYLAPEVYDGAKYDPQPTDIWSLAIIFACMTLRRFPWKVPRVTDNSYRLFVLPPDPGTPGDPMARRTSETRPKSVVESANGGSSHPSTHASEKPVADGSSSKQSRPKSEIDPLKSPASPKTESSNKSEVIKGPWRLLRLLPRESRTIIGKMLEIDPKRRATIDEMLQDPWIRNSPVCQQLDDGKVVRAEGHTHVLEPGSAEQPAPPKK